LLEAKPSVELVESMRPLTPGVIVPETAVRPKAATQAGKMTDEEAWPFEERFLG